MISYLRTCVGGWCLLAADTLAAAAEVLIPADPERHEQREAESMKPGANGRPDHAVPGDIRGQIRG